MLPRIPERRADPGQPLSHCDQIEILGALALQCQKDIGKARDIDFLAQTFLTDGIVLAIAAFEGTAGKKYGTAAGLRVGRATQTGLFPMVQCGACHQQFAACAALAGFSCQTVGAALTRA